VFLALVVGIVDYMTGTELSISIFYLLPISLVAWFVDRRAGIFLSLISSVIQLVTDIVAGHTYSHPIIVYWNNAVQLGFFLIIVFISSALKVEYQRTVRLNAKLKRTQDELERKAQDLARSNVELEQFAYVAAHDLKGPLIAAGGHINRLRRLFQDRMHPDATRSIEFALDGITRMEALINGLLAYAKAGRNAKKSNPSDCNDIVELATANLQTEIEKTGATVTHNQLPTVFSDDIQILQLFQNLIGNSIKFHKEEPPRIHICAEQNEKEWVFSVCDNGIGIEPKHLNCIFDIFQRLHNSSDYPGNGIGLAICKKIVENHGGRIWVESEPGRGSTFYFTIPIKDATTTQ
jgi:light-regulated signal transduction histidine kinase (bacteriophytochrome)